MSAEGSRCQRQQMDNIEVNQVIKQGDTPIHGNDPCEAVGYFLRDGQENHGSAQGNKKVVQGWRILAYIQKRKQVKIKGELIGPAISITIDVDATKGYETNH